MKFGSWTFTRAFEPSLLMDPIFIYQNDALKRRNKLKSSENLRLEVSKHLALPQLWDWLIKSQIPLPMVTGSPQLHSWIWYSTEGNYVTKDQGLSWPHHRSPSHDSSSSSLRFTEYTPCARMRLTLHLSQFILTATLKSTSVSILQMSKLRLRKGR